MHTELYWIDSPTTGRLAVMPRPRGGDWLEDEARAWKRAGVGVVVSLLTPDEIVQLDLVHEAKFVQASGLSFVILPIDDRDIPRLKVAAAELISQLAAALTDGKNVAIHCRQGLGRAPMIAAAVLVWLGLDLEDAIARVSQARGCPIPETSDQRHWLTEFARTNLKPLPK